MSGCSDDAFLGGRLVIRQPLKGYRAGIDPVLLAAACPAVAGDHVLDLGCGVGTAALCLATRVLGVKLAGVEVLADYVDLARHNGAENGIPFDVIQGDAAARPTPFHDRSFDHVITNPPYFPAGAHVPAGDTGRARGRGGQVDLDAWLRTAAKRLKPKGTLTLIQKMDRLPEVLAGLQNRLGSVVVTPITATPLDAPALVIVQARKSGKAAFRMQATVPLRGGSSHGYTDHVEAILRQAAAF